MASSRRITLNELDAPFKIKTVKVDGVTKYDSDNAYPTRMERLINGSVTSKSAAGMLKRFLIGNGFKNPKINDVVVGRDRFGRNVTLYHVLAKAARSISYYAGFYIRVQYNGDYKITGLRPENFKHCRFGELDSGDYSGKVVVYNNWDSERGRVKRDDFVHVDTFNTNREAIIAQIEKAGDMRKWPGQMFFWFDDDEYIYPTSPVDPVLYDADTEKQISLFKNGELRRGFFLKYVVHHTAFKNKADADEFKEKMAKVIGGGHEYSSLVLEGEFDDDGKLVEGANVHVQKIEQNVNDKIFDTYESSCINNIRKAFNAIPQILIDYEDGKLGTTSGEALRQASMFYNTQTSDLREQISQCFRELMLNWHEPLNETAFEIEPLNLGNNGVVVDV